MQKHFVKQREPHKCKEMGYSRFFRFRRELRVFGPVIFKAPKEVC